VLKRPFASSDVGGLLNNLLCMSHLEQLPPCSNTGMQLMVTKRVSTTVMTSVLADCYTLLGVFNPSSEH